jgi:ketosteroid isomerase-like protein
MVISQVAMGRHERPCEDAFRSHLVDLDLWAADVEYIQTADAGGDETIFHGRDGVVRAVDELIEAFDDFRVEPERFFDMGDRVLAFVRLRGRARRGGVPIDAPFAHVATFRGSQIVRWHAYAHRDEALEAVGLAPHQR